VSDDAAAPLAEIDALRAEQRYLAAKVERLEALVEKMARELGIDADQDAPSQD
jgi:outer membrane murein-binding lipoprotein Lpp